MAKLSSRPHTVEVNVEFTDNTNTKGETKMTQQLRTLNLTLVDNNPNLKAKDKIVFQALNYVTEHTDDRTIQQILMTGEVAKALEEHNTKRVKVVDKQIQRNTGRDVKLEEVEIFDLDWQVVRVAQVTEHYITKGIPEMVCLFFCLKFKDW